MPLNTRIALTIHAYYLDVFASIISKIPPGFRHFDIFVTCPADNKIAVHRILAAHGITASILICPNRGMDVVPFLECVRQFELYRYAAIVKLHTKNNKDLKGTAIANESIARILLDEQTLFDLRDLFLSDNEVIVAGPDYLFKHANYMMYNNRKIFSSVLQALGLNPSANIGFFAGTMFWIRGSILEDLASILPDLLEKWDPNWQISSTGGDGSLAHALERVWCALSGDQHRKVCLIYPLDNTGTRNIVRVTNQARALAEPFRRLAVGDTVATLAGSCSSATVVAKSGFFDTSYYNSQLRAFSNPGVMPELHYVLYGEPLGIPPSTHFSPAYYALRRPDVLHSGMSLLAHYKNFGAREKMIAVPTSDDWLNIAEQRGIFEPEFYISKFPHAVSAYGSANAHYRTVGRHIQAAPSANLSLSSLPVLEKNPNAQDAFSRYLEKYRMDESSRYHELARLVQNNDFSPLRDAVDELVALYGNTSTTQIANALYFVHLGDIDGAGRELETFWRDLTTGAAQRRHVRRLTSYLRRLKPDTESWQKKETFPRLEKARICVYTTLFGDIDELPPVLSREKGIDYICFTDRSAVSAGWERRFCQPEFVSNNLSAKIYKILPHKYLAEYEYSMFIDANTLVAGRVGEFIARYLLSKDFAMWAHPERESPYVEMCAVVEAERHAPTKLVAQMRAYQEGGLPSEAEMYEASFIWRRHHEPAVAKFMETWWEHICRYSERDQLSLSYLTWKTSFAPAKIDGRFGTSRSNTIFFKIPHLKSGYNHNAVSNSFVYINNSRRGIHVLYSDKYYKAGSNVLRGEQLTRLIRQSSDGDVVYSPNDVVFDKLVIATKGYVLDRGVQGIVDLKSRGNIVLLDLVDGKPADNIVSLADGLIASSINAMKNYRHSWVNKPAFHVTHHVDFRLPGRRERMNNVRIGYFGEIANTILDDDISDVVTFNRVDTSREDLRWVGEVSKYNCHYAVRRSRGIDGPKPFLKGFIAAKYRSNLVIQRDAGDALYYLGADYPYLLAPIPSSGEILEMLAYVKESFGGPEWRYGLLTMRDVRRRSSDDFVIGEIKSMLREIVGAG